MRRAPSKYSASTARPIGRVQMLAGERFLGFEIEHEAPRFPGYGIAENSRSRKSAPRPLATRVLERSDSGLSAISDSTNRTSSSPPDPLAESGCEWRGVFGALAWRSPANCVRCWLIWTRSPPAWPPACLQPARNVLIDARSGDSSSRSACRRPLGPFQTRRRPARSRGRRLPQGVHQDHRRHCCAVNDEAGKLRLSGGAHLGKMDALTRRAPASYRSAHVGRRPGGDWKSLLYQCAHKLSLGLARRKVVVARLECVSAHGACAPRADEGHDRTHARRARHAVAPRQSDFAQPSRHGGRARKRQSVRSVPVCCATLGRRGDFEAFRRSGGAQISLWRVPARRAGHCRGVGRGEPIAHSVTPCTRRWRYS